MMFPYNPHRLKRMLDKHKHQFNRSLMLQKAIENMPTNTIEYEYAFRDLVNARLECIETDKKIYQNFITTQEHEQIRNNQRTSDSLE